MDFVRKWWLDPLEKEAWSFPTVNSEPFQALIHWIIHGATDENWQADSIKLPTIMYY